MVYCACASRSLKISYVIASFDSMAGQYILQLCFLLSFFLLFSLPILSDRRLDVYRTTTGPSANLECRSEMCCTRLTENTEHKNSPSAHHRTTLSGYIFITKARIDNQKKFVKQQYLLHIWWTSAPTDGWHQLAGLRHPCNFQRVLRLGFITAPTSLNGGQPNFARCLAIS